MTATSEQLSSDAWKQIARQVVRSMRGRITQRGLSRRMGFSGNPVREWEAGRRFPNALQFLRMAQSVGVDPLASMSQFFPPSAEALKSHATMSDAQLAEWLNRLRGSTPIHRIAQHSGLSRFAVGRALRGSTNPRLPDFLALVHAITDRVDEFAAALVDIDQVPALLTMHKERRAQRELAFNTPWTEAIMRLFETDAYKELPRHREGWISERLGIDLETEQKCVELMLEAGVVVEDQSGRIGCREPATIYTGVDPEGVRRIKGHWLEVAGKRLSDPGESDLFSYNVMSLSSVDLERVRRILQNAYREIREVVSSTDNEEVAALLQFQLIQWNHDSRG